MNFEQIIYDKNGPVLTVTLNRPDKLNAYTGQMQAEIISALDAADADDEIRAIIFTGAGRGFCAGADLGLSDPEPRGFADALGGYDHEGEGALAVGPSGAAASASASMANASAADGAATRLQAVRRRSGGRREGSAHPSPTSSSRPALRAAA